MPRVFSIEGSLVSLDTVGDTAVWSRESPVNLERTIAGSLQLYPIESHHPGISYEDGSFLLEPACSNLITWNMDLSQSAWIKGSPQVSVRADYAGMGEYAPDGTPTSDRLRWDTGTGDGQKLTRTFQLEAGSDYTLSAILRLRGGKFGANDYIRVTGDIDGTYQAGLTILNDYSNLYKLLTLPFKTGGRNPTPPGNSHQVFQYTITALTQNTATLTIPVGYSVAVDSWKGGQLSINNHNYLITTNTATSVGNQSIIVTVSTSTIVSDGNTTSMKASLLNAPMQSVTIELYSEKTVSVDWGGMQLEKRSFRTSMIYQDGQIEPRAKSLLHWRKSPIGSLKSFALYLELKEWRGNGNLFNLGNLTGTITSGKLVVQAGNAVVSLPQALPSPAKILVQVAEATSTLSVYVNGSLAGRAATSNFSGQSNVPFVLSSEGLRCWQRIIVWDETLLEGQVNVGDPAKLEVLALFENRTPIDSVAISAHAPLINLPPVMVPAKNPPVAETIVTGVGSGTVTVKSASGFVLNTSVKVMRGDYLIGLPIISGISGNVLTLEPFPSMSIDDVIVYGESASPGKATVRFPFEAVDPQIIAAISTGLKRVTLSGVLAWKRDRALVRTPLYEDVAEASVLSIDPTSNYLFLSSVDGISQGDTISQPRDYSELFIATDNYFAGLIESIPGVQIAAQKGKWLNGLVIENWNPFPVSVTPYIRPYL
jgi:hypothetical protein